MSTPEQNRAEWLAANPGAEPVSPEVAQAQVEPGSGGPETAVLSGEDMVAAGAHAGLPHEAAMDQFMEQIKALSEQVGLLQERDQQREQAAIAALGEPIAQRYANAVRDHLVAIAAANPGGAEHFRRAIEDATKLAEVVSGAISKGANDFGQAAALAQRLDRFISRGHARTAPHLLRQVDLSTVGHHFEYFLDEVARLAPDQQQPALTG